MSLDLTRRIAFSLLLCILLPRAVSAQRMDATKRGVGAMTPPRAYGAELGTGRGGFRDLPSADRPSLGRHTLYGALAGAVLWGVYFALPCDGGCDGSRAERFVLLPAFAGLGASAGLLTGLLRGGR